MRYRADIDGLRALAIVAVVGSHVGIPGFGGGFVGVDAFFVISGFLITTLLKDEQERSGRIDIRAFYARRVRRLAPALGLILAVALAAGFFMSSPDGEQQSLAQSAISVTTFVSNMYFGFSRAGYFLPSGQYLPLLHTWSLGVEEQFYLFWPLVMIAGALIGRRWNIAPGKVLTALLALGSVVSVSLCFLVLDSLESVAFYSFPTRAWELGAGALLALLAPSLKPRGTTSAVLAGIGCIVILLVVVLHQPTNIFTGRPALAAVIGAVMIIAGGSLSPASLPTRLLGSGPMVMIGKLSYSWYLWHWVLLAFARNWATGAPSLARDLTLAAVALGLAALTWKFVEQPVRRQKVWLFATDARSLKSGAAILVSCAALAGGLWLWGNHQLAHDADAQMAVRASKSRFLLSKGCESAGSLAGLLANGCMIGADASGPLLLIMGDSHARHLVPGLADFGAREGVRVLPAVKSSCLIFPFPDTHWGGILERRQARCAAFHESVLHDLAMLKAKYGLTGVVIAGRWQRDREWEASLPRYLEAMHAQGLRVVLVSDIPGYPYSVPRCVAHKGADACRGDRAAIARSNAQDLATLRRIAKDAPDVVVREPLDALCNQTRCDVAADGGLLYSDANHLSYAGSRRVARYLRPALEWVVGGAAAP